MSANNHPRSARGKLDHCRKEKLVLVDHWQWHRADYCLRLTSTHVYFIFCLRIHSIFLLLIFLLKAATNGELGVEFREVLVDAIHDLINKLSQALQMQLLPGRHHYCFSLSDACYVIEVRQS